MMRAAVMTAVTMIGLVGAPAAALAQADSVRRTPPRIVITPRQPAATPYPLPGAAWPGPGHVRDCVSWLEPDPRPSGTVIVPRMRCAWVRGKA
jgi:hypothetical protein